MRTNRLDKLRQLSWEQCWWIGQAILFLPVIHLGLITLGYSRLRKGLEKIIPKRSLDPSYSDAAILHRSQEIARLVSIAARHGFYQATCLRRSLLLWWFLRRDGIPGRLCFGTRFAGREFEAHAWVEVGGCVVNDSPDIGETYKILQEDFPATRVGL